MNFDGSVKWENLVGCGGICKNDSRDWIVGFNKYLGYSSMVMAELWGLYTRMKIA